MAFSERGSSGALAGELGGAPTGLHGAVTGSQTASCPACQVPCWAIPGEHAFPPVSQYHGFPVLTYIPLSRKKKKEIKLGQEGEVSFKCREAHRRSVSEWPQKEERGTGSTSGGSSWPSSPMTPNALALSALVSKAPSSFLSRFPQRAPVGSSQLLEFTLFCPLRSLNSCLERDSSSSTCPSYCWEIKSLANKQSCLHITVERKATDLLFEHAQ